MSTIIINTIQFLPAASSPVSASFYYREFSSSSFIAVSGNPYTIPASGILTSPITITGLIANSLYIIRVETSCGSFEKKIKTAAGCDAPERLSVTVLSDGIRITFDPVPAALYYEIEVYRGDLNVSGALVNTYASQGTTIPVILSDYSLISPPGDYYVRVISVCIRSKSTWTDYEIYTISEEASVDCSVSIISPWIGWGTSSASKLGNIIIVALKAYGDGSIQQQIGRVSSGCWPPCNLNGTGSIFNASGNFIGQAQMYYTTGGYISITSNNIINTGETIIAQFDQSNCGENE